MNKENYTILHKLFIDFLVVFLVILFGLLLLENVLPGYFSDRTEISFLKIILAFGFSGIIIYLISRKSQLSFSEKIISGKTFLLFSLFLSALLIANALWKFSALEIISITIVTVAATYFAQKVLLEEKEQ